MTYKKDNLTSFALGTFAVCELLKSRPSLVRKIYVSRELVITDQISKILERSKSLGIGVEDGTRLIERIGGKDNIYLMAEFLKFSDNFDSSNQIVLHNPSDMGNVGTILRTALGFGFRNIAFIRPCVDVFNPRVVRASQGAIFALNIQIFDNWQAYLSQNGEIHKYLFVLDPAAQALHKIAIPTHPVALIFGNEAAGLPAETLPFGTPIFIQHSHEIDSLNLGVALGIAAHHFSRK